MQADDLTFHRYREYDISGAIRCEGVRRMVTAVHGTIAGRRTSLALFLPVPTYCCCCRKETADGFKAIIVGVGRIARE